VGPNSSHTQGSGFTSYIDPKKKKHPLAWNLPFWIILSRIRKIFLEVTSEGCIPPLVGGKHHRFSPALPLTGFPVNFVAVFPRRWDFRIRFSYPFLFLFCFLMLKMFLSPQPLLDDSSYFTLQ